MLTVDVALATSLFIIFSLLLVISLFLFYNYPWKMYLSSFSVGQRHQCPICSFLFEADALGPAIQCPRCQSLLDGE